MDKKVRYSAIVLDDISRSKILAIINVPDGWTVFAHHMTLCLEALPDDYKSRIGEIINLTCTRIGGTDKAIAIKVDNVERFIPGTPHITVAVNTAGGGKPKDSNEITNWIKIGKTLSLSGTIEEIY